MAALGASGGGLVVRVDDVPFALLCSYLDRLAVAARRRKHELLEELWSRCGRQDLFPLMRLLLPQLDLERSVYGLRELGLARIYADILGVAPDSEVAQRLRNYRVPLGAGAGAPKVAGDFAAVLLDVLEGRCVARNDALTLGAVNATLDELNSKTEPADKRAVFVRVLATYTARQQYWLARIVLKDLKVGVRHESALKLFHERALDVYNATTDLRRVCASVLDGRLLTQELSEVCLFKPFRPMLCGKQPWDRVVAAMGGARFVVQPKYDGERIVIHKRGAEMRLFTRNAVDYTHRFNYGAAFAEAVRECVAAQEAIVDGEVLTWNEALQQFEPFGTTRTVALGLAPDAEGRHLCFIAFDLLWLNGRSLQQARFADRRRALLSVVRPRAHVFEVAPQVEDCRTTEDVMRALDDAVASRLEGVVVKNVESRYELNERGAAWIKLKADYVEGLSDSLDLLLMGIYFGEGRRAALPASVLLGVAQRDPGDAPSDPPRRVLPFCKAGGGLTDEIMRQLREQLLPRGRRYAHERPPALFGDWRPEPGDRPHLWFEPCESILVELRCTEITPCPPEKFPAGVTARFPRVLRLRLDKPWTECLSHAELLTMHRDAARPRPRSALEVATAAASSKAGSPARGGAARRRVKREGGAAAAAAAAVKAEDALHRVADVFGGLELCVASGDERRARADVEALVFQYGGTLVRNPMPSTRFVVAGARTFLVNALAEAGRHSIVSVRWVDDCVARRALVPLVPARHVIAATPSLRAELALLADPFGDHFTALADTDTLRAALAEAARLGAVAATPRVLSGFAPDEAAALKGPLQLFLGCVIVFPRPPPPRPQQQQRRGEASAMWALVAALVRVHSGVVADQATSELTHLVVDADAGAPPATLRTLRAVTSLPALSHQWVLDSVRQRTLLPTRGYELADEAIPPGPRLSPEPRRAARAKRQREREEEAEEAEAEAEAEEEAGEAKRARSSG